MGWLELADELDPDELAELDELADDPEEDEPDESDAEVGLLREEPEIWDGSLRVALLETVLLKEVDERDDEDDGDEDDTEEPPEVKVELPIESEEEDEEEPLDCVLEREFELPAEPELPDVLAVVLPLTLDWVEGMVEGEKPELEKLVLDDGVLVKLKLLGGPALQKLIALSQISSNSSPECATVVCDGFATELPDRLGKHEEHLLKYC